MLRYLGLMEQRECFSVLTILLHVGEYFSKIVHNKCSVLGTTKDTKDEIRTP